MVWYFRRRHPRRDEPPSPLPPSTPSEKYDPLAKISDDYAEIVVAILERAQRKALKHKPGDMITVRMKKAERERCDFPVLLEELVFNRADDYKLSPEHAYHETFTFTVI